MDPGPFGERVCNAKKATQVIVSPNILINYYILRGCIYEVEAKIQFLNIFCFIYTISLRHAVSTFSGSLFKFYHSFKFTIFIAILPLKKIVFALENKAKSFTNR